MSVPDPNARPLVGDTDVTTIKSVRRVLEIFEFLDERRQAFTLRDVMDRFGYPSSSASVLLKSIRNLGYLEYDRETRTYMPTMRMSVKVNWVESALFGSGSILPAMQKLHDVTEETVSLGTQSDLLAQYVHQIPTRLGIPYPRIRQTTRHLARSGLGWLLLSPLPDLEIEQLFRRIDYTERETKGRICRSTAFREINQVRRRGYVFSKNTVVQGAGFIGMLLPSRGSRQLALGLNGPVQRLFEKEELILRTLRTVIGAADSLSGGTTREGHPALPDTGPVLP